MYYYQPSLTSLDKILELFFTRSEISTPFYAVFFFFNDTATTEIYTLSLHDALPIFLRSALTRSRSSAARSKSSRFAASFIARSSSATWAASAAAFSHRGAGSFGTSTVRSEEHTSELQSHSDLVCRLLLEKKKNTLHH